MDFIFTLDRLRAGARLTRPGLYPNFLMLRDQQILLVEGNEHTHYEWIPGHEDIMATDWYISKPPTQVAKPAGFVDSVVKGL